MAKFTCREIFSSDGFKIESPYLFEPTVFSDDRGYFMETFNSELLPYIKCIDGRPAQFVQENESKSVKNVLRGLHFQKKNPQGKLVRVIDGSVFDVLVDLRQNSTTFMKWFGTVLCSDNKKQLYVPEGFAHGFLVLSQSAIFAYKCTREYDPNDEYGIIWNDPDLGIEWPLPAGLEVCLSAKDRSFPRIKDIVLS